MEVLEQFTTFRIRPQLYNSKLSNLPEMYDNSLKTWILKKKPISHNFNIGSDFSPIYYVM